MKKIFIILSVISLLFLTNAKAQESNPVVGKSPYIKGQMTVTAAYSKSILDPFEIMKDNIIISTRAMKGGNIQVLYGVNNWLECGLDLDVCYKSIFREKMYPDVDFYHPTFQCYLGETAKIHLLKVFWPQLSFVDPYVSGLVGVLTTFSQKGWPAAQFSFYGQLGAGIRLNPTRHIGLFAEYGITTKKTPYTLFGINVRFSGLKKWQK
ncbi:MAG: hypothetical protein IJ057_01680 [Bacteroidales bacterium]|nr:hypothetical protein [Bacteroidales bacterium]